MPEYIHILANAETRRALCNAYLGIDAENYTTPEAAGVVSCPACILHSLTTTVLPLRCDFCNVEGEPAWLYSIMPNVGPFVTSSEWAACAECKVLVDAENHNALIDRIVRSLAAAGHSMDRRADVELHLAVFFSVKNGAGMRWAT